METPRRNKRTYCSPKTRVPDSNYCDQDEQPRDLTDDPCFKNSSTSTKLNRDASSNKNKRKQINYKIQNYAKILSEIPEKISREKNQDHLFFKTANTQIFQTKVAYFPGKNLNDIRKVLNPNRIEDQGSENCRINSCTFTRKPYLSPKDKTFGKHLISPKKKSKKMKAIQKPLNTIEEVNENDRSKECLKEEAQKSDDMDIEDASSSINMSYTDVSDNPKRLPVETVERKIRTTDTVYGQKASVSYMFQVGETIHKTNTKSSTRPKASSVDLQQKDVKGVHEIRNMFEKMSKNEVVPEKHESKLPTITTLPFNPIHFEHTISCEECRRILQNLIQTEHISKKDMKLAMSEIPHDSARQIVDSLIQDVCESATQNLSNVSLRIEMKNTTTISKVAHRRNRRRCRKRREDVQDMQYKNFFLLALAISIVLYCFYCRLNEKKS